MPYKKGGAAEARAKVRRSAKRRIQSLERQIAHSDDLHERDLFHKQIESLREHISKTYERNPLTYKATGYTHDELRMAVRNLERVNEATRDVGRSAQSRKNFITQQEMNHALPYDPTGSRANTKFTAEEMSVFYRATQRAWQGLKSTENRNRAILSYYRGESWNKGDFEAFVKDVLNANEEIINELHAEKKEKIDSGELRADDNGATQQQEGSTVWSDNVVSAEQVDALMTYINEP